VTGHVCVIKRTLCEERVIRSARRACVQEVCRPQHVVRNSNQSGHNACSGGVVGLGTIRAQSEELLLVTRNEGSQRGGLVGLGRI
jgi:hypothetical protein